jgi:4-hydroxymandelate oxidase
MLMTDALPHAEEARRKLGEPLYHYLLGRAGGAGETDPNVTALSRYRLVPRVLRGTETVDPSAPLAGRRIGAPLAIGAFAGDRLFHPDGLLPIAALCRQMRLPLFVSEETVTPLAEITALHDDCWLQLRAAGPRERAMRLADAAAKGGARGLILTLLAPTHPVPTMQPGGFSVGRELAARGWSTIGSDAPGIAPLPTFPAWRPEDLAAVVRHAEAAGLPVLAKGILHPDDARAAEEAGCAGVIVSNIGLRQTRRWVPAVEQLPALRAAAGRALLLDGGIRSGADAVVAAALGTTAAISTRPVIMALAAGGEARLRELLAGWLDEIRALLVWCGVESPAHLGSGYLSHDDSKVAR